MSAYFIIRLNPFSGMFYKLKVIYLTTDGWTPHFGLALPFDTISKAYSVSILGDYGIMVMKRGKPPKISTIKYIIRNSGDLFKLERALLNPEKIGRIVW